MARRIPFGEHPSSLHCRVNHAHRYGGVTNRLLQIRSQRFAYFPGPWRVLLLPRNRHQVDKEDCKGRNVVERSFNTFKQ